MQIGSRLAVMWLEDSVGPREPRAVGTGRLYRKVSGEAKLRGRGLGLT